MGEKSLHGTEWMMEKKARANNLKLMQEGVLKRFGFSEKECKIEPLATNKNDKFAHTLKITCNSDETEGEFNVNVFERIGIVDDYGVESYIAPSQDRFNLLSMRARFNEHRHATPYYGTFLETDDIRIKKLMEDGKYDEAYKVIRDTAITVGFTDSRGQQVFENLDLFIKARKKMEKAQKKFEKTHKRTRLNFD